MTATKTNASDTAPRVDLSTAIGALLLICFLLVPLIPGEFPLYVATEILIFGLFALSFNLIYGYMGQISFGHAAFFGVGAYAFALCLRELQRAGSGGYLEFLGALALAIPASALAALIVGFFCVRLVGIYFSILSLAFGELLYYIVFSWYGFTGGDDGIQGLLPPPWFRNPVNYYFFTLSVVALATLLMWRIVHSPFGFVLRMIRDNQRRTAFLGVDVRKCMLVNFVVAGAFAGVAGALWAPFSRSVSPVLLGWMQSGIAVFMTLIGGAGYFVGPLVGSSIYTLLNAYVTRVTPYWPLTIGIIILLLVLFQPGGVLSIIDARLAARNQGRSASAPAVAPRSDA